LTEVIEHDILVLGSGLAGLRAAIEAKRKSKGKLNVGIISKLHAMRSHSVSPEGGAAAVLEDSGDNFETHERDTILGSDFLADQDVVEFYIRLFPREILQLEHWGCPWSRDKEGKLLRRRFGAHGIARTFFAGDRTGFNLMKTLYDTALKNDIKIYHEFFVTSLIVENNEFKGLTAIERETGKFLVFNAKAGIIATGGGGRLYKFCSYAHTVTGDGIAMAYKAGLPLKDMEFVQFLPTCMIASGIPATEAMRGDGALLFNKNGERFMKRYAPTMMELSARDIVDRAIMREILDGNGYSGPDGLDYVLLDARPVGEQRIKEVYQTFRENAITFQGLDPLKDLIPIRPAAHYTMGGIHVDISLKTPVEGLWAAGEVACVSFNGANRLGSNSLPFCLASGAVAGSLAAEFAQGKTRSPTIEKSSYQEEETRLLSLLKREGNGTNVYEIKRTMQSIMEEDVHIFRNEEGLKRALTRLGNLSLDFQRIRVSDKSSVYNNEFFHAIELGFMLDVTRAITLSALTRTESRGAHYRSDYPNRDDQNWLKHTLIFREEPIPRIELLPVRITKIPPAERKY
jgi:succinate dehydrogenase / fumarate reductase, flavoprotein subunit